MWALRIKLRSSGFYNKHLTVPYPQHLVSVFWEGREKWTWARQWDLLYFFMPWNKSSNALMFLIGLIEEKVIAYSLVWIDFLLSLLGRIAFPPLPKKKKNRGKDFLGKMYSLSILSPSEPWQRLNMLWCCWAVFCFLTDTAHEPRRTSNWNSKAMWGYKS